MSKGPMLGRAAGRHGSCCGGPPGPDCTDHYKGKKAQRAHERRQWRREEDAEPVEPLTRYTTFRIDEG